MVMTYKVIDKEIANEFLHNKELQHQVGIEIKSTDTEFNTLYKKINNINKEIETMSPRIADMYWHIM